MPSEPSRIRPLARSLQLHMPGQQCPHHDPDIRPAQLIHLNLGDRLHCQPESTPGQCEEIGDGAFELILGVETCSHREFGGHLLSKRLKRRLEG